jgi:adenylate cyclase
MGEVCLADDLLLQRQVALKFLSSTGAPDGVDHLLDEARSAAALDHPFICSIYEVTTVNERPCIAMEYVRGETLERRLRRGPLGLTEGLRVAEEIAEALEAAHRRRVIHRDLKPANVMLTEAQHIKVMDFGLAMRMSRRDGVEESITLAIAPSEIATVRGTPAYMPPEQIRGAAVDHRTDIFAFGILLYELLTGINPFRRVGIDATIAAILGQPVVPLQDRLPGIPPALGAAVARMLAKDPAGRYPSFTELRSDLRRVAIDLSAPAASPVSVIEGRSRDGSTTLIGRDAERARLVESIIQAGSGRGALIVLSGEAGVGKTRLADEGLNAAQRLGYQVLAGRCYEQDGTPPLIPYVELIEQASRLLPASVFREAIGPSAPELAKLVPELQRLIPDMAAPLELPPQLRQRFLFTNIREFLTRCGRITPLVVFIDDFQWADELTLQLTQHLAQHLSTLPIVIMAAYREMEVTAQTPGALTPSAITLVNDLVRRHQARLIPLRPFTHVEVRAMLAALGQDEPPARLVRKFAEQTGGNPFFLEELFRHLSDEGDLFDASKKWKRDLDFHHVDIPESLRAVVERRVRRISSGTLNVLKAAAVIGLHFDLDVLEAVVDVDPDTLLSAVEEAEEARLVKGPSGRQERTWRFAHQLIRHTLAGAVPHLRRQRLHRRVADAIARLAPSSQASISEVAHHLYSAGRMADAARTADALMTAGDAAREVYATEEAVQHYRRALEVLQGGCGDQAMRLRIEEHLADLLALLGDGRAAMEHYQNVAAVHAAAQARVDQARIARKTAALHWQAGERGQAIASHRRALDFLGDSEVDLEAAHLYHALGLAAFRSGDNHQAIEWAERALRVAEAAIAEPSSITPEGRKTAMAAIAHATNTIGVALARSGQLDAACERIERSLTTAREQGLLDVACRAYANLGVLYSSVAPKRAIDVSLTGLELASRIGAATLQSYLYANLAAAYCALTDKCETEGRQAAKAAVSLDRELGQLDHLAVPLIVLGQIHQCHGELQAAQEAYTEALTLAERIDEPQLMLPCYDGLATICLDRGDKVLAERYLLKARELCERTGLDPDAVLLLPFLC